MTSAGGSHDTTAGLGSGPPPAYGCTVTLVGSVAGAIGTAEAQAVLGTSDADAHSLQPASFFARAVTQ